jgi:hypothetical protein
LVHITEAGVARNFVWQRHKINFILVQDRHRGWRWDAGRFLASREFIVFIKRE